ncbi:hypothetical protein [Treponema pedis]|uniref:Uncharacterized protein n=1 Tax=Treponema pedis TaxID=409322 RepID=A0A7S6WMN1_9SPIR|nr:hypothetical protein [Treponema pedis]QOW59968.1 hypothetical protein IFE08_08855 [Treponema pedis]
MIKVFYYDYALEHGIDEPRIVDLQTALQWFYELTDESDNFFGLVDDNDRCIQFMYVDTDEWLVDIPCPPDFVNWQKTADYDECVAIIKEVYKNNRIIPIRGMVKQKTV